MIIFVRKKTDKPRKPLLHMWCVEAKDAHDKASKYEALNGEVCEYLIVEDDIEIGLSGNIRENRVFVSQTQLSDHLETIMLNSHWRNREELHE